MLTRLIMAVTALLLAVSLGACSTMDVVLEKGEDIPTVSAVARAPTSVPMKMLIARTNDAMAAACGNASVKEVDLNQPAVNIDKWKAKIGGAEKVAEAIKTLLDTVRSWFPKNTYTAARKCM